jgi:NAD(P)H-dependent FMN reductase
MDLACRRRDAEFEIVDLRAYPMPFFEEEQSPMFVRPHVDAALRWARKMAELDGYVFVMPEYNHGIPAVLKNALDYAYAEYGRKPASFVGYGGVGAARGVEQLRSVLAALQMAPLKQSVHINAAEFIGLSIQGKTFSDYPYLTDSVGPMLDNLLWWANALRAARALTETDPITARSKAA